jgi:pyruvate dehydrogenase E2 component (dihydrolipoamide acetyltransferase)
MDVKLPKLGEGAESGTVVGILVKAGDEIQAGQTIIELENEKAVAPIPAPAAGKVAQIFVKEGQSLSVGQRILALAAPGEAVAPAVAPAPKTGAKPKAAAPTAEPAEPAEPVPAVAEPAAAADGFAEPGGKIAAAPSLRKMARELGIDLGRVRGSEAGGRIVMDDVRAYIQRLQQIAFAPVKPAPSPAAGAAAAPAPVEAIDFAQWGPVTRQPLSSLRKTISRRMLESWTTLPQVNQFDEADISLLNELRAKYQAPYEAKGVRLTLTPLILKAVAAALKAHPVFNASLDDATSEIVLKQYVHLGLAVDTEAGLIVPVIRDVDQKSVLQLARDVQDLAERTRSRKVGAEEMRGGTFTISNQGGIGGGHFTPIINKPEVAILGLGRSVLKPVVRAGQIEPRLMMPLCVSYDHRLIDGGAAARFVVRLVAGLQDFPESELKI